MKRASSPAVVLGLCLSAVLPPIYAANPVGRVPGLVSPLSGPVGAPSGAGGRGSGPKQGAVFPSPGAIRGIFPRWTNLGPAREVLLRKGPPAELIEIPVAETGDDRSFPDSGRARGAYFYKPTRKVWFVYGDEAEKEAAGDVLRILMEDLGPEASIEFKREDEIIVMRRGKEALDEKATAERLGQASDQAPGQGPDLVLAANQELYEALRELRDHGRARELPMGFTGKRFVSVDVPKRDIDLHGLNDASRLPHRNYFYLSERRVDTPSVSAGRHLLQGRHVTPSAAVEQGSGKVHSGGKKGDADMGPLKFFVKYLMWRTGQADDRETAALRRRAHALGEYLDSQDAHILVIDDPETSKVVGLMKKMGYHVGLPVIWRGPRTPADPTGINLADAPGGWLDQAPWVTLSRAGHWTDAVAQAPDLKRLPYNFMEKGGPSVARAEAVVNAALEAALPALAEGSDVRAVGAGLTNGNGTIVPGDANPFGHAFNVLELRPGEYKVATVWYEAGKGGPMSGLGSRPETAMSLAEYPFTTRHIPEAPGQPTPLGDAATGRMLMLFTRKVADRPVDRTSIGDMLQLYAKIDAMFQQGRTSYKFIKGGTNCAAILLKGWKKIGAAIYSALAVNPMDVAVNIFGLIGRELMDNMLGSADFMIMAVERPYHASPADYRIDNSPIASPMYWASSKPWDQMNLLERAWRFLQMLYRLPRAMRVPRATDAIDRMAGIRLVTGPNSRVLRAYINPQSPVIQLRVSDRRIADIRQARNVNNEGMLELNRRLTELTGFSDWRSNPELQEKMREWDARTREAFDAMLGEHKRLGTVDSLHHLDEMLENNRRLFLKIRLLDPLERFSRRLDPVRLAYQRVLELRELLVRGTDFEEKDINELDELNAGVFKALAAASAAVLRRYGLPIPPDVRLVFERTSAKDFEQLLKLSRQARDELSRKRAGRKA